MTERQPPRWLIATGVPLTVAVGVLAVRLIWEQTLLSWNRGPQMVGFSLTHSGVGVLLFVALILAFFWFVAMLVFIGIRRRVGGKLALVTVSICALSLAALSIPYSWWQTAFASRLAAGPYAADFLVHSAADGQERLVKAFLAHGVPVDSRTLRGTTALHAAAMAGQLDLVQLLIARGADINAVNRYGNSPLANAEASGQEEVAAFLRERGAQFIRGTDEQHRRASDEIVDELREREHAPAEQH
jgi:hypothetical protein